MNQGEAWNKALSRTGGRERRLRIIASQHLDINRAALYPFFVRTTLDIDDDLLRAAKSLARAQGKSLGRVVSGLVRRGLEPRRGAALRKRFPIFAVSAGAAPMTPEAVKKAEEEG
jgi:hypothetical protein